MRDANPKTELETALSTILESNSLIEEDSKQGRHQTISFKVTQAEKERLQQRCCGIVLSDYIRARLFDYPLSRPKTVMPLVNRETLYHLKCIEATLKQQTQVIQSSLKTGEQPLTDEIYKYLSTLNQLSEKIYQLRREIVDEFRLTNDD
ncbi:hypothetical protein [Chroococcus sp. FPU101]|uniref:plasmid mobilization protein n=1 Tax=Chroococcus sp. FPU101 TaxID=1974212 RepID=UPI001A8C1B59|nr:hypothetical protein [Chroococcus sp. FPU101]GFE71682.1 hypothetical protein CFPU101_42920 [Chroococcus sp. FPU101]